MLVPVLSWRVADRQVVSPSAHTHGTMAGDGRHPCHYILRVSSACCTLLDYVDVLHDKRLPGRLCLDEL